MFNNNSPLENLAAFAIAFASGAMSVIGLIQYIAKVRRDTWRSSRARESEAGVPTFTTHEVHPPARRYQE